MIEIAMEKTSFGQLKVLLEDQTHPVIEHLIFEQAGRPHLHDSYETFFVMKGRGIVHRGESRIEVSPNSLVTIPPKTFHYMEPAEGEILEGFIWYHSQALS